MTRYLNLRGCDRLELERVFSEVLDEVADDLLRVASEAAGDAIDEVLSGTDVEVSDSRRASAVGMVEEACGVVFAGELTEGRRSLAERILDALDAFGWTVTPRRSPRMKLLSTEVRSGR